LYAKLRSLHRCDIEEIRRTQQKIWNDQLPQKPVAAQNFHKTGGHVVHFTGHTVLAIQRVV